MNYSNYIILIKYIQYRGSKCDKCDKHPIFICSIINNLSHLGFLQV